MKYPDVDVCMSGAVLLGRDVVCDGFHVDRAYRVQTHVHADHMTEFDTSKGLQTIFMSTPTRRLLEAEYNADLSVRTNVIGVAYKSPVECGRSKVTLVHSGHMLGSSQVMVEDEGGLRVAYSGDFHWPLTDVVETDVLVIDSTYGSPNCVRRYSQEDAEIRFSELMTQKLAEGRVYLTAHRGTLQRAIRLLGDLRDCTLIASKRVVKELEVYQHYGYVVPPVVISGTAQAKAAAQERRVVRIFDGKDQLPVDMSDGTAVSLSAFGMRGLSPILEHSERSYTVALSDHADFPGTLEYVRASKARFVVTDNTRRHGVELAMEIKARLGIDARPSSNCYSAEWGRR